MTIWAQLELYNGCRADKLGSSSVDVAKETNMSQTLDKDFSSPLTIDDDQCGLEEASNQSAVCALLFIK